MACRVLEDVVREEPSSPTATRQADAPATGEDVDRAASTPGRPTPSTTRELLEQSPKDPELLQWRAIGFVEQGKEKAAATTLEKAIGATATQIP